MGHSAKKLTLIIYTMQTCVLENMAFQNMDYTIQTAASPVNAIWTAYNQGKCEEDGACFKMQNWTQKRKRKIGQGTDKKRKGKGYWR
jgi:hypothetical protein